MNVVSYNIHKGLNVGNRHVVLRAMGDALKELEPDIVLLQEVVGAHGGFSRRFSDWSTEPQAEYIAQRIGHASAYGQNVTHSHGGHGNAVLSRYRLLKSSNVDLSCNRWEQRGMVHTVLEVRDGDVLHACSVHLGLRSRDRMRQVKTIAQYVDSTIPEREPLIIGGDFNDWRGNAGRFLTRSLKMMEVHAEHHGRHARTFPSWRPVLSLDRICVRGLGVGGVTKPSAMNWRRLSDHMPVLAELRLDLSGSPSD